MFVGDWRRRMGCEEGGGREGKRLGDFSSRPKTLRRYGIDRSALASLGTSLATTKQLPSGSCVVRRRRDCGSGAWGVMSKGLEVNWSSVVGDGHVISRLGRMEGSHSFSLSSNLYPHLRRCTSSFAGFAAGVSRVAALLVPGHWLGTSPYRVFRECGAGFGPCRSVNYKYNYDILVLS